MAQAEPYAKISASCIVSLSILIVSLCVLSRTIVGRDLLETATRCPEYIRIGRLVIIVSYLFLISILFATFYAAWEETIFLKKISFWILIVSLSFLFRVLFFLYDN